MTDITRYDRSDIDVTAGRRSDRGDRGVTDIIRPDRSDRGVTAVRRSDSGESCNSSQSMAAGTHLRSVTDITFKKLVVCLSLRMKLLSLRWDC